MSKRVDVTDFKTKRINQFTGGKIADYTIPDYPKSKGHCGYSFLSKDGSYIGSYDMGWWYVKKNMIVCDDYPHGVSIVLKKPAKQIKSIDKLDFKKDVKGYCGYSHRGGVTFTIGDRLFDEKYRPKESDYTKSQWNKFSADRNKSVKQMIKEGYSEKEAMKYTSISDAIPFRLRGRKIISTWEEAKKGQLYTTLERLR